MKIPIISKDNSVSDNQLTMETATCLLKAGYRVQIGREKDKTAKNPKYIQFVEYDEGKKE